MGIDGNADSGQQLVVLGKNRIGTVKACGLFGIAEMLLTSRPGSLTSIL